MPGPCCVCSCAVQGCMGGQPAVLKVFSADDPEAVAAFLREAGAYKRLAAVQGQCIPQLLALGRQPHTGAPMIALSEHQPVQPGQLSGVVCAAAEAALQALHAQGVAHGDVHAGNLLTEGSRVLLCDLERACSAHAGDPACEKDVAELVQMQEGRRAARAARPS